MYYQIFRFQQPFCLFIEFPLMPCLQWLKRQKATLALAARATHKQIGVVLNVVALYKEPQEVQFWAISLGTVVYFSPMQMNF
jgi:hypothetical protein